MSGTALTAFALMAAICAVVALVFAGAFKKRGALAPVAAGLLVSILTSGVYLWSGRPDLLFRQGDGVVASAASRQAPAAASSESDLAALEAERAALSARADAAASDWGALGERYRAIGAFALAAEAFGRAVGLAETGRAEIPFLGALAETLIIQAEGVITPEAETAFRRIAAINPGDPGAEFYLGKAAYQAGYVDDAIARWSALWARTPSDAPWREILAIELRQAGVEVADLPAPQPPAFSGGAGLGPVNEEARAAIMALSPEEQDAFIRDRVASLAARLDENGSTDPQEWGRLGFVYERIGRFDDAAAAYAKALEFAPEDENLAAARDRALSAAEGR